MAVTKRTRFEVLRRDDHTCQYCGAKAPDVTLHIDHVMPVALGGDDKPGNLVTACKDCNAGKTSIMPDSPLVEGLSDRAAAYALGMVDKMTRFRSDLESLEEYVDEFHEVWDRWMLRPNTDDAAPIPLPSDYRMSLFRWKKMGVPTSVFGLAIPTAHAKYNETRHMALESIWKYMAGVVWNMINQREIDYSVTEETAAVYTESEMHAIRVDAYETGSQKSWSALYNRMWDQGRMPNQDFLAAHIDGSSNGWIDEFRGGKPKWQESMLKSA